MNTDESTDGICDNCGEPIKQCECEINCNTCEDAMPRKHKCAESESTCSYCGEPNEDCNCQPSGHYD